MHNEPEETEPNGLLRRKSQTWQHATAHFGTVVVMFPIVLSIFRVMALGQGDPATIVAITTHLDVKALAFGSIFPLLPFFAFPGAVFLTFYCFRSRLPGAAIAALILATLFFPFSNIYAMTLGLYTLITFGLFRLFRDRFRRLIRSRTSGNNAKAAVGRRFAFWHRLLFGIASTLIASVVAFNGSWLPVEVITRNGSQYVVNVLSDNADSIVVLYTRTRAVERINSNEITSRKICTINQEWIFGKTLHMLLDDGPEIPRCPN